MKNIALVLTLSSVATLSAIACGDSDSSPGDGGKGGSSATSGASGNAGSGVSGAATGGTAGSAGTPATGGASGTATGGTAGGGMSGASGTGNAGGVGAEGGMGEGGMSEGGGGPGPGMGCPANEPMAMTMCPTRGLACDYNNRTCRCNLNTGNWQCFDTNPDCPAMPDPGGNCTGGQTACGYGVDGACICIMGNFTCDNGVVACPATRPMNNSSCNMFPAGFDCSYAMGDCSCGTGPTRQWNCQTGMCPGMAPNNGAACPAPGQICPYMTPGPGADQTCVCNTMSQWTCL